MKQLFKMLMPFVDVVLLVPLLISAFVLKFYRLIGSIFLPICTASLKRIGVFPILDHYYEPLFNDRSLSQSTCFARDLPGIDMNLSNQFLLLDLLNYKSEFDFFIERESSKPIGNRFVVDNGSFEAGDAEVLFGLLRHVKPKRIIEIGCGASTRVIQAALALNDVETDYRAVHTCIEPYEQSWLDDFSGIELIRSKVEDVDPKVFSTLEAGDLLFIDSSHVIRPQGDVLTEYLKIIPSLCSGVYIHVHDIFTPFDYPVEWTKNSVRFWNEQYLLEALLTCNDRLEVLLSVNFLKNAHFDRLSGVCSYLDGSSEPGSFYIRTK
jgi:hypothetical protein